MVITSMSNNHTVSPEIALSGVEWPQGALAYDHKMLWRANLYIKEGNDWNDSHKWNSSDNYWNRIYNFDSFEDNDFKISSLVQDGNGGQVIDIPSFTHSWQGTGNTDIDNAVAYEFNGTDSPFAFLYKMDNQLKILSEKYTSGGDLKTGDLGDDATFYNEKYTAPYSLHKNYAHGFSYPYGASESEDEDGALKLEDDNFVIDDVTYRPYVPALESAMIGVNAITPYNMLKGAGYGAGTDCLGFVNRSAAYEGNPYSWVSNSLTQPLWGGTRETDGWPKIEDGDGILVTDKSQIQINQSFLNLEKVVPGDIFYYKNTDGNISHILIVSDVDYKDGDTRFLKPEGITFIESTHFWEDSVSLIQLGYIRDYRTLAGAENKTGIKNKSWYALRLK